MGCGLTSKSEAHLSLAWQSGGAVNGSVECVSRGRVEGWFPVMCCLGVGAAHRSEVTEDSPQGECTIGPSHVSLSRAVKAVTAVWLFGGRGDN